MKKMQLTCLALLALAGTAALPATAQVTETESVLKAESKATDDGWRVGGVTNLNFSQLFLANWAAGGQNSFSLNGLASLSAAYRHQDFTWDNTLDLGYGFLNQKDDPIKDFRKTDDKFEFNSKVGYKAFSNFYYAGLVNFKSQFSEGYDYAASTAEHLETISGFFAPAYLTAALGLSYQPNSYFSAFLAPVSGKMTFVTVPELRERYGVDPNRSTRSEFGGYLRTVFSKNDFQAPFLRNITLTSKLDLFSNYLDHPQYIDVNWEVLIAMKVNKFLSVNINTNLIYDFDVKSKNADGTEGPAKVQFKELLGIGLSYNF